MKLKDKKIQILENVDGIYYPVHPGKLWAYYRQLSGKEKEVAYLYGMVEDAQFIINWRDDLHTDMVIVHGDKNYTIARIDDFEGYKKDLALYGTSMLQGLDVGEYRG